MDIYRNYDGNFENELSQVNQIDENVKTEIAKIEELLNNINSSWQDRNYNNFISHVSETMEEIKGYETSAFDNINNLLDGVNGLFSKYKG